MAEERKKRDRTSEAARKFALLETVALDERCSPLMVRIMHITSAMADADGEAWPSYDALTFITGAARQNVILAVERLWQLGYFVSIEKDAQTGRSRENHYRLATVAVTDPVWTLYRAYRAHVDAEEQSRKHDRSWRSKASAEQSRQRLKQSSQHARTVMLACPDPFERSLGINPSSDTTVSVAAAATTLDSKGWKGTEGEVLPHGFPDKDAMADAASWAEAAGVQMNLTAEKSAFRSHHYSVRCMLTDWNRSWERWIDDAIDRERS